MNNKSNRHCNPMLYSFVCILRLITQVHVLRKAMHTLQPDTLQVLFRLWFPTIWRMSFWRGYDSWGGLHNVSSPLEVRTI